MNPLKKLVGQTAIYGVSSIVGRITNFLLVPLYTNVLNTDEYGLLIYMYLNVAIIYVFLIYGMETAFFRYNELIQDKKKVFNTSFISITISSLIFIVCCLSFSSKIAELIEQPLYSHYVRWFVLIMAFDAIAAIPFAKLRADNRPIRFATIKFINIGINVGLNLFFILFCPYVLNTYSDGILFNFIAKVFNPDIGLVA